MKREYSHNDYSSSKRPRYNNGQDSHVNPQSRPYNNHRHASSSQGNHSASQPDPTKDLDSLLKALIARPDATKLALGQDALDSAINLSNSLTARINTATASFDLFQPPTIKDSHLPTYSSTLLSQKQFPLPALPQVPKGPYSRAPFTHKSSTQHDRTSAVGDLTYERLEFLGDAYIEVIATRLIFSRYYHLPAGRQAQIRERLVKNETLSHFSTAYRFQDRLQAQESNSAVGRAAGKILADVFEAYVAAVILSDPENGFKTAETWLTELWAPMLLRDFGPNSPDGDVTYNIYNASAKQELQQQIVGKDVKLEYLEYRPMEQTKHAQKYFISLFLTGWGHEKLLLGSGEGQNKVEAGNRAAMDAMIRSKAIVDDCAWQLSAQREWRKGKGKGDVGDDIKVKGRAETGDESSVKVEQETGDNAKVKIEEEATGDDRKMKLEQETTGNDSKVKIEER